MPTIRLRVWLAGYRQTHEHRFHRDHDWLRLSVLGSVLLAFSTLASVDTLAMRPLLGDVPGGSAMFSGATIVLFIVKIARAEIYGDWILNGVLYVGVGVALSSDEAGGHASPSILFCLLLTASGVTRIWIGRPNDRSAGSRDVALVLRLRRGGWRHRRFRRLGLGGSHHAAVCLCRGLAVSRDIHRRIQCFPARRAMSFGLSHFESRRSAVCRACRRSS
jgi:uncharacterized membrane protein HdeD (DUF308 family)